LLHEYCIYSQDHPKSAQTTISKHVHRNMTYCRWPLEQLHIPVCCDVLVMPQEVESKAPGVRPVIMRIGIVLASDGGALGKMLPMFQIFAGGPLGGCHSSNDIRQAALCKGLHPAEQQLPGSPASA
jgi:hypothetical protein